MNRSPDPASTVCMGVRFDHWAMEPLVQRLLHGEETLMVVTPNTDHVVRCNRDPAFARLYGSADISFNDSRVLTGLTWLAGNGVGNAMCGSDVTAALMAEAAGTDTPITIIGCSEATVAAVVRKYRLQRVHHHNPPMGFIHNPAAVAACVDFMRQHPARLVIVSVGSPRQEQLARLAIDQGVTGALLCVGASLLFLSGEEKRAPRWVQQLAMEWLFRLVQSPKRLAKRYLVDDVHIFRLLWREFKRHRLHLGADRG